MHAVKAEGELLLVKILEKYQIVQYLQNVPVRNIRAWWKFAFQQSALSLYFLFFTVSRVIVLAVTWRMNRELKWRHIWAMWTVYLSVLWYVAVLQLDEYFSPSLCAFSVRQFLTFHWLYYWVKFSNISCCFKCRSTFVSNMAANSVVLLRWIVLLFWNALCVSA